MFFTKGKEEEGGEEKKEEERLICCEMRDSIYWGILPTDN